MKISKNERNPKRVIPQQDKDCVFRIEGDEEYRYGIVRGNFIVSEGKAYHMSEILGWMTMWEGNFYD